MMIPAIVLTLLAVAPALDITPEQSAALLMLETRATPAMLDEVSRLQRACAPTQAP